MRSLTLNNILLSRKLITFFNSSNSYLTRRYGLIKLIFSPLWYL